jgi:hypothetical protein
MSFSMHFSFVYEAKGYLNILEHKNTDGPIPRKNEIIFFSGKDKEILESKGLVEGSWRVEVIAYDYKDSELERVTLTLYFKTEHRTGRKKVEI